MDRLRIRIARNNESQGGKPPTGGYHETLTRFWVEMVSAATSSLPQNLVHLEVARVLRIRCSGLP